MHFISPYILFKYAPPPLNTFPAIFQLLLSQTTQSHENKLNAGHSKGVGSEFVYCITNSVFNANMK